MSAVNDALAETPETVNSDPYGEGWLLEIEVHRRAPRTRPTELLDAQAYQTLVDQG